MFVVGGGGCIGWVCGGSSICYITPEWACSGHTGRLWPHVASLGRRSSGPRSAHWRQGTSLRSGPHPPPSTVLAGHFSRNSIDLIRHHKFNWLLIFHGRGYGSTSGKQTVFHEKNFWPSTFFSDGEIFPGAGWIEVEKFVLSKLYESFTKSCCTCPSTQQSAQRPDIVE